MAYAVQQDLIDRFGDDELMLYCDRNSDGVLDAEVVAGVLLDANAMIDRHLAGRYQLPLSVVDPGLTRIASDLARYWYQGDSVKADGAAAINFKQALAQLRDLADGRTTLQAAGVAPTQVSGGGIQFFQGGGAFDPGGY